MEDPEIYHLESLQVVHHRLLPAAHPCPLHCLVALLNAGMYFLSDFPIYLIIYLFIYLLIY